MPLLTSSYRPPVAFRIGHWSTIYHGLFRRVDGLLQQRERIGLPDGDFLDLDWSLAHEETDKVVLLFHGLEGDAQRPYITGSAKQCNHLGLDACAVNLRGCSGEPNMLFRAYHSGATEDVESVVAHVLSLDRYNEIYLMGFSLGANLILKYLGERTTVPTQIRGAMAVSAPCDLRDSLQQLQSVQNYPYANMFRKSLVKKLWEKQPQFPESLSPKEIRSIRTLRNFDDIYTSRAHGFTDALDYYQKSSSKQFLPAIKIPTLILNALDDSFLGEACYPFKEAGTNPKLFLETPKYGGHVGFYDRENITYAEKRVIIFLKEFM